MSGINTEHSRFIKLADTQSVDEIVELDQPIAIIDWFSADANPKRVAELFKAIAELGSDEVQICHRQRLDKYIELKSLVRSDYLDEFKLNISQNDKGGWQYSIRIAGIELYSTDQIDSYSDGKDLATFIDEQTASRLAGQEATTVRYTSTNTPDSILEWRGADVAAETVARLYEEITDLSFDSSSGNHQERIDKFLLLQSMMQPEHRDDFKLNILNSDSDSYSYTLSIGNVEVYAEGSFTKGSDIYKLQKLQAKQSVTTAEHSVAKSENSMATLVELDVVPAVENTVMQPRAIDTAIHEIVVEEAESLSITDVEMPLSQESAQVPDVVLIAPREVVVKLSATNAVVQESKVNVVAPQVQNSAQLQDSKKLTQAQLDALLKTLVAKPSSSHSYHALCNMQQQRLRAALLALSNLQLDQGECKHTFLRMMQQLRTQVKIVAEDRPATKQEIENARTINTRLISLITNELKGKNKGVTKAETKKQVAQALKEANIQDLNARQWNTVTTSIKHNGQRYDCSMIPASQMRVGDAKEALFPHAYHGKGVSSASTQVTEHAANLWLSNIADADGVPLFQGVRHGVLTPIGVEDPTERHKGAVNRAMEVATAALYSKPQLLDRALQGETVSLRMTSTALLTPGKLGGEGEMLQEQVAAWQALCGQPQPIEMKVRDEQGQLRTISVNLQVLPFNFGVNEVALKLGPLSGGAHAISDKLNEPGLHTLLGEDLRPGAPLGGWVGEYLRDHPANAPQVLLMAEDLKNILAKKNHHTDGGEPYKAAQRLSMLTYMIGAVPAYNCKSGKDRTGMQDAEIKREAIAIHQGALPSEAGQKLDTNGQKVLQQVLLHGGNLEVQRYNTGVQGGKVLKEVPLVGLSYKNRIGDDRIWREAQGLSPLYVS